MPTRSVEAVAWANAPTWRRAIALWVDLFVSGIGAWVVLMVAVQLQSTLLTFAALIPYFAYFMCAPLLTPDHQTIGHKLLGLYVLSESTGAPPEAGQIVLRGFAKVVSIFLLPIVLSWSFAFPGSAASGASLRMIASGSWRWFPDVAASTVIACRAHA